MADSSADSSAFSYTATLRLALGTPVRALAARRSLEVDLELDATTVRKQFVAEGGSLRVEFAASSARMLRVALSSFFDMSKVVVETLDEFGTSAE